MIAANRIGIRTSSSGLTPPSSSASRYSTIEISATAPPPTPLNSATICGIAVIRTERALGIADGGADHEAGDDQAPVVDALVDQRRDDRDRHADGRDLVAADGRARPAQHVQPDDEEREGDDVEELDDVGAAHSSSSFGRLGGLRLEHPEHAVGDEEAADDVDRPERDRDHEQDVLEEALGRPDHEQAAEDDDAVDRVGPAHQRRVQRVRDLRDDLEADEGGEDEDRELGQEVHQRSGHLPVAGDAGAADDLVLEVERRARPPRRSSARAATRCCARRAATRARPCGSGG